MIVAMWRGLGGNREVPPRGILGGAEAYSDEEGGSKANDVATINALVTAALAVAF
jgi:hypothetical protein